MAPYVQADRLRLGILLAYPPRLLGAAIAAAIAVLALSRRDRHTTFVAAASALLFITSAGWGGDGVAQRSRAAAIDEARAPALTLLSHNVHNQPGAADVTAAVARREHVDIVTLQEVRPPNRKYFISALPDFAFFWADPAELPERRSTGVFASMIGLRRERFDDPEQAEVLTGITGYRTFAVETRLDGRPLWVVNVHATKPFWLEDGLLVFVSDAPAKARWHQDEAAQLALWAAEHADTPAVFAGDFNAPHYARVMQLDGLHSAFTDVGRGPNATFPAFLPVWGIDHVLGNSHVAFSEYRVLDAGPSDHLAQLARLRVDVNGRTHDDAR